MAELLVDVNEMEEFPEGQPDVEYSDELFGAEDYFLLFSPDIVALFPVVEPKDEKLEEVDQVPALDAEVLSSQNVDFDYLHDGQDELGAALNPKEQLFAFVFFLAL